jgi:hypothetical protein
MFKAIIKNSQNVNTNEATFRTRPEAETWGQVVLNTKPNNQGFSLSIIDNSEGVRKQRRILNARKRLDFGIDLMVEILAINEERLELGLLTEGQFQAILSNPVLANIERLIYNGSIGTARSLIASLDDIYFNSVQKEYILEKIDSFLESINQG